MPHPLRASLLAACLMAATLGFSAPTARAQAGSADQGESVSAIYNKRVTLELENADIRYALKLLFQSVGANYTLDQAVQGSVTVSLKDVSFRTALESILRSVQSTYPLTYRVENNVFNISPKVENVENTQLNPETPEAAPPTRTPPPVKVQVNFADAADIATAFGGSIIQSNRNLLSSGTYGSGLGGGMGGMMGGMGGMGGFGGGMGGFGGGMGGFGGGMGGFGGGMGGFGGGGFGGGGFGGGGFGGGGFGGGGFGGGNFGGGGFGR